MVFMTIVTYNKDNRIVFMKPNLYSGTFVKVEADNIE